MASANKNSFFGEFKEFISKGNVLDMAVGVVVGGAFTAIVNSLVKDILMPLVGHLTGSISLEELKIVLDEATGESEEVAVRYGSLISAVISFLIFALCMFFVVKGANKLRSLAAKKRSEETAKKESTPEVPSEEILLLREIRDSLTNDKR